jgi:glyoxylase I family protein
MIQIRGLDHVVLRVRDLAKMLVFYTNVLGCPLERAEPDLGLYQLRAGSTLIDLVPVESVLGRQGGAAPHPQHYHNVDHIGLRVEPFDPAMIVAFLAQHGVQAGEVSRRYGAEGFGVSLYITDPEGNTLELKGAPDVSQ